MKPEKLYIKEHVIDTLLLANPYFNNGPLHYIDEVGYILEDEHNKIVENLRKEIFKQDIMMNNMQARILGLEQKIQISEGLDTVIK